MTTPRGVRNNNPGNIDRSGTPWQGEDRSDAARRQEPRFCVFFSPEAGFRALAKVLLTYRRRYGLDTVSSIIARWAPPRENDTGAYVREVSRAVGVGTNERLAMDDAQVLFGLAKAIARHENGGHFWADDVIRRGVAAARA